MDCCICQWTVIHAHKQKPIEQRTQNSLTKPETLISKLAQTTNGLQQQKLELKDVTDQSNTKHCESMEITERKHLYPDTIEYENRQDRGKPNGQPVQHSVNAPGTQNCYKMPKEQSTNGRRVS